MVEELITWVSRLADIQSGIKSVAARPEESEHGPTSAPAQLADLDATASLRLAKHWYKIAVFLQVKKPPIWSLVVRWV